RSGDSALSVFYSCALQFALHGTLPDPGSLWIKNRLTEVELVGHLDHVAAAGAGEVAQCAVRLMVSGLMSMWNSRPRTCARRRKVAREGSWSPASRRATCGCRIPSRR